MSATIKRWIRLGALGGLLVSALAVAAPVGPDPARIAAGIELIRSCKLDPALELLDGVSIRYFEAWRSVAQHAEKSDLLTDPAYGPLLAKLRRLPAPIEIGDVLAASCAERPLAATQTLLKRLNPGPALVNGPVAWVPLLGHNGEYPGLGLVFVQETTGLNPDHAWKLQLNRSLQHEWILVSPGMDSLYRSYLRATPNYSWDEDYAESCPVAAVPEPGVLDGSTQEKLESTIDGSDVEGINDELPGPRNGLSALQRQAIAIYAEGLEVSPSPVAQAIYAEVLYRSAFFATGPGIDTPVFWQQLERALQFARRAEAAGIPLTRLAPLLTHYAQALESGTKQRAPDLAGAAEQYRWAARSGDGAAAVTLARYQVEGLGGLVPDCRAAQTTLSSLADPEDPEAWLLQAQIAADCPDPTQRQPQLAKDMLKKIADLPYDPVGKYRPAQVQLALNCQQDPSGPGCANRKPVVSSGERQAELAKLRADWLADGGKFEQDSEDLPRPGTGLPELDDPEVTRPCE